MATVRTYQLDEIITFCKTRGPYGELSNCHMDFPLYLSGLNLHVKSTEHLYQALKHPDKPALQEMILREPSPIGAKHLSYTALCRPDWITIHVKVMAYLLAQKTFQHYSTIAPILLSTGDKPIVEYSRKDNFWGAVNGEGNTLVGVNALGRLWMERRMYVTQNNLTLPPYVESLKLLGQRLIL